MYWTCDSWDGPKDLQELLDVPENLKGIVGNNSPIILKPSRLTDQQVASCKSDLKLVLKFLKSFDDVDHLEETLATDDRYTNMRRKAA